MLPIYLVWFQNMILNCVEEGFYAVVAVHSIERELAGDPIRALKEDESTNGTTGFEGKFLMADRESDLVPKKFRVFREKFSSESLSLVVIGRWREPVHGERHITSTYALSHKKIQNQASRGRQIVRFERRNVTNSDLNCT